MKRCRYYLVLLKSIRKMLCSLITNIIVTKHKCGDCLFQVGIDDRMKRYRYYSVVLKSIPKMLYTLATDSIATKVQRGECLFQVGSKR